MYVEYEGGGRGLTVIRRVFDGGEGSIRGGRVERSSERVSLALLDVGLDDDDVGGDALCAAIIAGGVSRGSRGCKGGKRNGVSVKVVELVGE